MPLLTPRLRIDALTPADLPALLEWRNDPLVAADQGWPLPYPAASAEAVIAGSVDAPVAGAQRAIRLRDGRLVGDIVALTAPGATHALDLGITLARSGWGNGYAAEALSAVVDELFALPTVHKLAAFVFVTNVRSQRLFERVGFQREGYLVDSFRRRDGTLVDEVLYGWARSRRGDAARQ